MMMGFANEVKKAYESSGHVATEGFFFFFFFFFLFLKEIKPTNNFFFQKN